MDASVAQLPLDLRKHLAINYKTQREQDQFIVDNAQWFECVYKTQKSHIPSEPFGSADDARKAARFATSLMFLASSKKTLARVKIYAHLQDSKGSVYSALVEEINPNG